MPHCSCGVHEHCGLVLICNGHCSTDLLLGSAYTVDQNLETHVTRHTLAATLESAAVYILFTAGLARCSLVDQPKVELIW